MTRSESIIFRLGPSINYVYREGWWQGVQSCATFVQVQGYIPVQSEFLGSKLIYFPPWEKTVY